MRFKKKKLIIKRPMEGSSASTYTPKSKGFFKSKPKPKKTKYTYKPKTKYTYKDKAKGKGKGKGFKNFKSKFKDKNKPNFNYNKGKRFHRYKHKSKNKGNNKFKYNKFKQFNKKFKSSRGFDLSDVHALGNARKDAKLLTNIYRKPIFLKTNRLLVKYILRSRQFVHLSSTKTEVMKRKKRKFRKHKKRKLRFVTELKSSKRFHRFAGYNLLKVGTPFTGSVFPGYRFTSFKRFYKLPRVESSSFRGSLASSSKQFTMSVSKSIKKLSTIFSSFKFKVKSFSKKKKGALTVPLKLKKKGLKIRPLELHTLHVKPSKFTFVYLQEKAEVRARLQYVKSFKLKRKSAKRVSLLVKKQKLNLLNNAFSLWKTRLFTRFSFYMFVEAQLLNVMYSSHSAFSSLILKSKHYKQINRLGVLKFYRFFHSVYSYNKSLEKKNSFKAGVYSFSK